MPGIQVDPLIAEAKQRARRRRLVVLAAAGLVAVGVLSLELAPSGTGGGANGVIPWLPTKPNLGPAHPPLAPACTASQLGASLFMQGASMSLVGPIELVNRSSRGCSLIGRPKLSFADATSKWRETAGTTPGLGFPFDPLAPPRGSLRAVRPGEHVAVSLVWSNWCGTGAKPDGNLTLSPSAIVLTAPGGGKVKLTNANDGHGLPSPVCNGGAGSLSTLQATPFTPFVPQGPPSSALPLKARIVSGSSFFFKGKTIRQPALVSRSGRWLSFTIVLTNVGRKPFHFGRACPAYVEGLDNENQAYVLNCHAVGTIAPRHSVRFAMRVHVPARVGNPIPALGWTLAPHSYNAPQAPLAVVDLR